MLAAALATRAGGVIENPRCVDKSNPGFWDALRALGGIMVSLKSKPIIVASLPVRSRKDLDYVRDASDADLVGLRLGYLEDLNSIRPEDLESLREKIIVTIRDPLEGGVRSFRDEDRAAYLKTLAEMNTLYDVEISFLERSNVPFQGKIVSIHYLHGIPRKEEPIAGIKPYPGRVFAVKIALPQLKGSRELITSLLDLERDDLAFMIVEGNQLERIALALMGSKLVYGYIREPTAPGQPNYKKVKRVIDTIYDTIKTL